jgi:hypothetical protein
LITRTLLVSVTADIVVREERASGSFYAVRRPGAAEKRAWVRARKTLASQRMRRLKL